MKTRIDNVNEYVNSMNVGIASLEKKRERYEMKSLKEKKRGAERRKHGAQRETRIS